MQQNGVIFHFWRTFVTKRFLFCFKKVNSFEIRFDFQNSDEILMRKRRTRLKSCIGFNFSFFHQPSVKVLRILLGIVGVPDRRLFVDRDEDDFFTFLSKIINFHLFYMCTAYLLQIFIQIS